MKEYVIKGGSVYAENEVFSPGFVHITNGKIAAAGPLSACPSDVPSVSTSAESMILPGAVDIHIHGAAGADTMDATQASLHKMAAYLPSEGTTTFLATTMTQAKEAIEQALDCFSHYEQEPGEAEIAGIHLEGPFISPKHPGAQPREAIQQPDVEQFQKWNTLSGEKIRLVTLAPEEKYGMDLVAYLTQSGVTASAGHTDATFDELCRAAEAGLTHITHLYNGMRGMHHREPGTAGGALLHNGLYVEMIVDGIHIHPQMVRLAFEQKTADRTILITDSMRAKGVPDGEYELGGQAVTVQNGRAVLEDGTLAGSTLSMQGAIQNMRKFTDCTIRDIVKMTAENPAKQVRLFERKGSIAPGKDADLVVYDGQFCVQKTICRGVVAFEKERGK
ncbi:N-acetylglucosamine-6-phosphate deacetylase [Domibacillus indicus]|uniref:N-acetylglucosamine-6-phosphate deacetylase n=1 Tax=Domibacillus indicus TaxID=1437523 RepID=UPI002040C2ED|nr:N-acetylglucosamine-6-phosphate deacetylase [Domibacillus indicus]MCM3789392.1 N-acetylglucosamine-6-phosphate deacetylase [Domibacillus indicus]